MLYENPGRPGLVRQIFSVFIGAAGTIDMDHVDAEQNLEADRENLSRTAIATHVYPNWKVSNTFNLLPKCTADSDGWSELVEKFEITLCPEDGVVRYGTFGLLFDQNRHFPAFVLSPSVSSRL
jgi:hypothetical protein